MNNLISNLDIPEMKRRFEILNATGERVFFVVEETGYLLNAFSYSSVHDFDYSFLDPRNGLEGFRVSSRTRLFGFRGSVRRRLELTCLGSNCDNTFEFEFEGHACLQWS